MTLKRDLGDLTRVAKGLKALLLDVDGVMTDGGIILSGESEETKRFDVQDGMGVNLARAAGMRVGIVTSRTSAVVARRANELNMDILYQGVGKKAEVLPRLLKDFSLKPGEMAYIGDDLQDIPLLRLVGLPIAVANAVPAVKETCAYVTQAAGGHGAVREAVEWLLELRGDRERVYEMVTG